MPVIAFPGGRAAAPEEADDTLEVAAGLHDLILDGVRTGAFAGHRAGARTALENAIADAVGADAAAAAKTRFARIYGVDPAGFMERLGAHRRR